MIIQLTYWSICVFKGAVLWSNLALTQVFDVFCSKWYFVLIFRSQINLCLQMEQFFCRISYFYFFLLKKLDKLVFKYLDIFVRSFCSRCRINCGFHLVHISKGSITADNSCSDWCD